MPDVWARLHWAATCILPSNPSQDMVVRREKVAVLTQGTLTDAEMLAEQPEASYLLALAELPVPGACTHKPGMRSYEQQAHSLGNICLSREQRAEQPL